MSDPIVLSCPEFAVPGFSREAKPPAIPEVPNEPGPPGRFFPVPVRPVFAPSHEFISNPNAVDASAKKPLPRPLIRESDV